MDVSAHRSHSAYPRCGCVQRDRYILDNTSGSRHQRPTRGNPSLFAAGNGNLMAMTGGRNRFISRFKLRSVRSGCLSLTGHSSTLSRPACNSTRAEECPSKDQPSYRDSRRGFHVTPVFVIVDVDGSGLSRSGTHHRSSGFRSGNPFPDPRVDQRRYPGFIDDIAQIGDPTRGPAHPNWISLDLPRTRALFVVMEWRGFRRIRGQFRGPS